VIGGHLRQPIISLQCMSITHPHWFDLQ